MIIMPAIMKEVYDVRSLFEPERDEDLKNKSCCVWGCSRKHCRLKSMLGAMWSGFIQRLGWLRWNIKIPVLALATLYSNTVTKS